MNLALIGLRGRKLRVRELGCAEGLAGPECPRDTVHSGLGYWLGPGNTNVVHRLGGWASTRYTTLPVLPTPHHPGYSTPPPTPHERRVTALVHVAI